jgi:hypothetical protein
MCESQPDQPSHGSLNPKPWQSSSRISVSSLSHHPIASTNPITEGMQGTFSVIRGRVGAHDIFISHYMLKTSIFCYCLAVWQCFFGAGRGFMGSDRNAYRSQLNVEHLTVDIRGTCGCNVVICNFRSRVRKICILLLNICIRIIFLLTTSVRLLSTICILGIELILVFWAFFGFLLRSILI